MGAMWPLALVTEMLPRTGRDEVALQVIDALPIRLLVTLNVADLPADRLTLPALASFSFPLRVSFRFPELPLARWPVTLTEPFCAPVTPSEVATEMFVTATAGSPVGWICTLIVTVWPAFALAGADRVSDVMATCLPMIGTWQEYFTTFADAALAAGTTAVRLVPRPSMVATTPAASRADLLDIDDVLPS